MEKQNKTKTKEEKHYIDMQTDEEKIIHILYAGKSNDYYGQAIVTCVVTFGAPKVRAAIEKFKQDEKETL
jgi:hypothetical protein